MTATLTNQGRRFLLDQNKVERYIEDPATLSSDERTEQNRHIFAAVRRCMEKVGLTGNGGPGEDFKYSVESQPEDNRHVVKIWGRQNIDGRIKVTNKKIGIPEGVLREEDILEPLRKLASKAKNHIEINGHIVSTIDASELQVECLYCDERVFIREERWRPLPPAKRREVKKYAYGKFVAEGPCGEEPKLLSR